MIDEPRRRTTDTMGSRVTVLEVEMRNIGRQLDRHMAVTEKLISKLDERADRLDMTIARLMAGLAVIVTVANLFAPTLAKLLGLPS